MLDKMLYQMLYKLLEHLIEQSAAGFRLIFSSDSVLFISTRKFQKDVEAKIDQMETETSKPEIPKPETPIPETPRQEKPKLETPVPRSFAEPLPEYFKENHQWNIGILKAPSCPNVEVIRLVKSSPFNSDLRRYIRSHIKNQGASNKGVFFIIGLHDASDQANAQKFYSVIHRLNSEKISNFSFEALILSLQRGEMNCKTKWKNSMILLLAISLILIEISHSKLLLDTDTSMNIA